MFKNDDYNLAAEMLKNLTSIDIAKNKESSSLLLALKHLDKAAELLDSSGDHDKAKVVTAVMERVSGSAGIVKKAIEPLEPGEPVRFGTEKRIRGLIEAVVRGIAETIGDATKADVPYEVYDSAAEIFELIGDIERKMHEDGPRYIDSKDAIRDMHTLSLFGAKFDQIEFHEERELGEYEPEFVGDPELVVTEPEELDEEEEMAEYLDTKKDYPPFD